MQLTSVETTPNPNSMKLNVDTDLGAAVTYTFNESTTAPDYIRTLLAIAGVKSVFACHAFLTLNKDPRVDWRTILATATEILGGGKSGEAVESAGKIELAIQAQRNSAAKDGQVHVLVQTFRGVPIQVKVEDSHSQQRISLGDRFNEAAKAIQETVGADFLKERYWADYGIRYGAPDLVAQEIFQELDGLFNQTRLTQTMQTALGKASAEDQGTATVPDANWSKDSDWQKRLAAVQYFSQAPDAVYSLTIGLNDSHAQVRRLAAAALGATGSSDAVQPLTQTVLDDEHVGVRRTAADALSDIGDVSAEPAMCTALKDKNKLVRWRAARFLCDIGTEQALPYLEAAVDDAEFEVRLEVEAALQRIRGKETGVGPAWKRIIEARRD
jgi:hypothetical protein